jgi:UDP-glucuronate decarboxylase
MAKKVLITGGGIHRQSPFGATGHEGYQVTAVDTFWTGSERNVRTLVRHPHFTLIHHDVRLPFKIEADQIYNLACTANSIHYQRFPLQTAETCVLGSINVLKLAGEMHACVLQASTSEVYGDPDVHPQRETCWGRVNPIGPRSCCDEGKRMAESLFFDCCREMNVDIRVARIFNTCGPRMARDDGRIVSILKTAAYFKPVVRRS